jgi:hypothetical protein
MCRLIAWMAVAVCRWGALTVMLLAISASVAWHSWGETSVDVHALFEIAQRDGRVGVARKSKPVDARAAVPGEVIVTLILGEGKETQSRPADAGDMVVRNRCEATGNEEYLVSARTFAERYDGPLDPDDHAGWGAYRPRGPEMLYFVVRPEDGAFTFMAPWDEEMVAKPGDVIIRNPMDAKDTYRVAGASFACTYEIVRAPRASP